MLTCRALSGPRSPAEADRRADPRLPPERWHTALTFTAPNKVLIRGYPLDEMMGRLSFADAVYLLLMGELPTPGVAHLTTSMRADAGIVISASTFDSISERV